MEEESLRWPEGTFEIVWHQHDPTDWTAEVTDTRSGQRTQVRSLEELAQFIQAHLQPDAPHVVEP
jgi:hypothetical protein